MLTLTKGSALVALVCNLSGNALAQSGSVPVSSGPGSIAGMQPDYSKAKPRPLPINGSYSMQKLKSDITKALSAKPTANLASNPNGQANPGDGKEAPVSLPKTSATGVSQAGQEAFGNAGLPYTTARADLDPAATNRAWPYRAAGKLFFVIDGDTYNCSGAMIGRGIVATAAHCVSEYGKNKLFSGFRFVPGYRDGEAPFGEWTVSKVYVLTNYLMGKDCTNGVVCQDDVAVLALEPKEVGGKERYAGDATGWFGYAAGNTPYTTAGLTQVTQLGYPLCLDRGEFMQRNDAQGAIASSSRNNTVYGSLMCGGSSGGPLVANFGLKSNPTDTIDGVFAQPNVVIGVTSWGYTDQRIKQQGSSAFTSANITFLVKAACKESRSACAP